MREAPAGAGLLSGLTGPLAVTSLIAGGFVAVSTLLFLCEDHFVGPVRDFWHIAALPGIGGCPALAVELRGLRPGCDERDLAGQ